MVEDRVNRNGWRRSLAIVNFAFRGLGAVLSAYLAAVAFGLSIGSSQHYSNFILATVILAGLLALRNLFQERIQGPVRPLFVARLLLALAAMAVATFSFAYIRWHATRLEVSQPFFEEFDLVVGFLMIFGVIILNWIHWGWLLSSITVAAIVYFFFGHNIDNLLLTHPPYDVSFVLNYIGLGTTQGFFWLAQLAADSIYFLVLYAAVLLGVGILDMVHEAGKAGGRRVSGGAAFASLFGSGVVGSVMGQAVSNVVLTGRLTIPMMKRYGYQPSMAAAIEATASTAGQILPPILGLAGFLIASFLNRPYIEVALAALIPGLLYLSGSLIGILVYSRYHNLPKLKEKVDTHVLCRLLPTFCVSFGLVLWLLLGYRSPAFAGLVGIMSALGMAILQGPYRPRLRSLFKALDEGIVLVTLLSLLLVTIGALGQTVMTTNLSARLGTLLLQVLPDSQLLMLVGAMLISIVLGMGLPTPVAYLVASLAMVPFLQQVGVDALLAHFFVFYFAVFSTLTPPIAVSILAAAKLAETGFAPAALHAMKLACTTFIVPFAFVYNPELMAFPNLHLGVIGAVGQVLAIQITVAVASYGYLFRHLAVWERIAFSAVTALTFAAMVQDSLFWYLTAYGALFALVVWMAASDRLPRALRRKAGAN